MSLISILKDVPMLFLEYFLHYFLNENSKNYWIGEELK